MQRNVAATEHAMTAQVEKPTVNQLDEKSAPPPIVHAIYEVARPNGLPLPPISTFRRMAKYGRLQGGVGSAFSNDGPYRIGHGNPAAR